MGLLGVVASVTQALGGAGDRSGLTADGQFRNCRCGLKEYDRRGPRRRGAGDDELADIVRGAVGDKWAGHSIGKVHFVRPARSMSQIGG